jgi:hypothetical protein
VLLCESKQGAVEFMLQCVQAMGTVGCSDANPVHMRIDRATAHLSMLFGMDQHAIDFMLVTRSLSSLASITTEQAWRQLVLETDGLIDQELLYTTIDWSEHQFESLGMACVHAFINHP